MNLHKLKILTVVLVCIAVLLGVLCVLLGRFPALTGNSDPQSTAGSSHNPSSTVQTTNTQPPSTTAQPTTETTTAPTTEPTTEPTTAPTTQPTTVPETTVLVDPDIGYQAAMLAADQIGKPYRYGGAGPNDFDASGLLCYCFAEYGVSLPRSTAGQASFGYEVAKDQIQPGDAVFFWSTNPGEPEYVGIYIGNSIVVAALNSSKPVVEFNMETKYYTEHYVYARRFY